MKPAVVIERAALLDGRVCEIRLASVGADWVIDSIGSGLVQSGDVTLDARLKTVLPGFTDHHLHLHALAARALSVPCGPPEVDSFAALAATIHDAPHDGTDGWVRGVGYIETVAGDLDRYLLDTIEAVRPVRIQHRSGALWMLNSAALTRCRIAGQDHRGVEVDALGQPTGRIWRADPWLRSRLPASSPPSLVEVGRQLRRFGIVEMTDATPDLAGTDLASFTSGVDRGDLTGQLNLLGVGLGESIAHPRIRVGPYKIVIADSDLPDLDLLTHQISQAHAADRSVAVHCVTHEALALLLAAWTIVGTRPGDRIEHAGLVQSSALADLARLGVVVVTQPGFLYDRGDDFLDASEARDRNDLYRCGSLVRAGIGVALSSDAPYGPLDPWITIAAATTRLTRSRHVVGTSGDAIGITDALALHCAPATTPGGPARRITPGAPGNLIVLDASPGTVLSEPLGRQVEFSVIDGEIYPQNS